MFVRQATYPGYQRFSRVVLFGLVLSENIRHSVTHVTIGPGTQGTSSLAYFSFDIFSDQGDIQGTYDAIDKESFTQTDRQVSRNQA